MIFGTLGGDTVRINDTATLDTGRMREWMREQRHQGNRLLGLDVESKPLDHEDRQNSYGPQQPTWLRLTQVADEWESWNLDPINIRAHREVVEELAGDRWWQFTSWSGIDPETILNCLDLDIIDRYFDAQTLSLLLRPGQIENHKLKEWAARNGMPELREAEEAQDARWKDCQVPAPRKPPRPRRRKLESDDEYSERLFAYRTVTLAAWQQEIDQYYAKYPLREGARATATGGYKMGWSGWRDMPRDDPAYQLYAGLDAIAVRRIWPLLVEQIKERGVYQVARRQELRLQQAAVRLRVRGVLCDRKYAEDELAVVRPVHLAAKEEFTELTGVKAGSPRRVGWFQDRGVEFSGRTKNGNPSLGSEHVKDMIARYAPEEVGGEPLCDPEAYRALELVKRAGETQNMTTFLGGILDFMDPRGRIHPNYRVLGAETGRWTVNNPAVQTFSNKNNSRGVVTVDPGHLRVSIDQAQIEVRVFAALAQDTDLIQAFNRGEDIYGSVATRIFGPAYTKRHRSLCKRIVLGGCLYGGGAQTLVTQLHDLDGVVVRKEEVSQTRTDFLAAYPAARAYLRKMNSPNDVWLPSGRYVPGDADRTYRGTNSACQGTARDILTETIFRIIGKGHERLIDLTVHDEILFSVPLDNLDRTLTELRECFTVPFRGVNVDCDVEAYPVRWGQDVRTWRGPGRWVTGCRGDGCKATVEFSDPYSNQEWRCSEHLS